MIKRGRLAAAEHLHLPFERIVTTYEGDELPNYVPMDNCELPTTNDRPR
jgi:hypothetical protein